ncbi:MAG: hypothetical protein NT166_07505 [Candidatus Aminicenantes bacterium]|nr:hypothetical protein [Candidatus Aminicenantes bacterium]
MSNYLGIDLGASYAKAVYLDDMGNLKPVTNKDMNCMFRVSGLRDSEGRIQPVTMDEERRRTLESGKNLIENVKPLRGEGKGTEELETAVLREILECYKENSGDHDLSCLKRAVLTHPVSAGPAAVDALMQIAVDAGLSRNLLDTIEEPVALGLFSTQKNPTLTGRLLVIDAGHYTTDFVMVTFEEGKPTVQSTNYLGLRLGAAEFTHALARSAWLKAQFAAGVSNLSNSPFDEYGPEGGHFLVNQLLWWAEDRVIRAMPLGLFDLNVNANLPLANLYGLEQFGAWTGKIRDIYYCHDLSTAMEESKSFTDYYPEHNPGMQEFILRENYRDVIKPLCQAIGAAALSVILEIENPDELQVVLGGGLSLVEDMRTTIEDLLKSHGIAIPLNISYDYQNIGSNMGLLLATASGAAIAAARRFDRNDSLADTIGLLSYSEIEEALDILDKAGVFSSAFHPNESNLEVLGARQHPTGPLVLPLHHILKRRGEPLPCKITFPQALYKMSKGGKLSLTRAADRNEDLSIIEPGINAAGGTVAVVAIPTNIPEETLLYLSLEIERNDVWQLKLTDPSGNMIITENINLQLKGKGGE